MYSGRLLKDLQELNSEAAKSDLMWVSASPINDNLRVWFDTIFSSTEVYHCLDNYHYNCYHYYD